MKDLGFTPGPWSLMNICGKSVPTKNYESILTIVEEDELVFGAVYEDSDAQLIATAPEMLEALIGVCTLFETFKHYKDMKTILPIIEKATGKTWSEIKELL